MKKFAALLLAVILCTSFLGCNYSYQYKTHAQDGFDIGYNTGTHDAYVATYRWGGNENNCNVVIPESYDAMPIIALGGYHGLGVPDAFEIRLPDAYTSELSSEANFWGWSNAYTDFSRVETVLLDFHIHISKNIEKIALSNLGDTYVGQYYDGENYELKVLVAFRYTFTCDENNETFYAKDGKLYYKENDTLVSDIFYYDHVFNSK